MGFGTNGLTFNTLRGANTARLPEFKNKHGAVAHSRPDGSDWSPAQWLQAVVGELGEFAQVRMEFEAGQLTFAEYRSKAGKELADVVTYLDILARRCLDQTESLGKNERSPAQVLMGLVACLGTYANDRKKYDRGDHTEEEFNAASTSALDDADSVFNVLMEVCQDSTPSPADLVVKPHAAGIDLGQETMQKFNEVSERVGSRVFVDAEDWHYRGPAPATDRRK